MPLANLFISQHTPFLLWIPTTATTNSSPYVTIIFHLDGCDVFVTDLLASTFAPGLFSTTARVILLKCQVREDQPYNFFLCTIKPLKWSSRCYMICKLLDPVLLCENSSYFIKACWPLLFNQTLCPPPHVNGITSTYLNFF